MVVGFFGAAEAAGAAFGGAEFVCLYHGEVLGFADDELSADFALVEYVFGGVEWCELHRSQYYFDGASVVGVDDAGAVGHDEACLADTAVGDYFHVVAGWRLDGDAGVDDDVVYNAFAIAVECFDVDVADGEVVAHIAIVRAAWHGSAVGELDFDGGGVGVTVSVLEIVAVIG